MTTERTHLTDFCGFGNSFVAPKLRATDASGRKKYRYD